MSQLRRMRQNSSQAAKTTKDDTAFLPYTSGTTGQPKGVVHTHGWAYAHLRIAAAEWLDIKKGRYGMGISRSWLAEMDLDSVFICTWTRCNRHYL